MDEYMLLNALEHIEDSENMQRIFYNPEDPFQLSDYNFIKLYRLRKVDVQNIIELLTPYMPPTQRASALGITRKILAALRFFAAGSYQLDVGKNFTVGISQPSVSRSLNAVINAFNHPNILNQFIHFPNTIEELTNARQRFYNQYDFPGIVGCVDGSFIAIAAPVENEHLYVNRKRYHSLNVQCICDEQMKILNVNARFPGSTHDSYIWQNSAVEAYIRTLPAEHRGAFYLLGKQHYAILELLQDVAVSGDAGYPLRPWLMTPIIPAPLEGTPEARYNERQRSIRSLIERCFGLLKSRFRCLLRHRTVHYCPFTAGKIVNACAVLHNICIDNNVPLHNDFDNDANDEDNNDVDIYQDVINVHAPNDLLGGRRIRQIIVRNLN